MKKITLGIGTLISTTAPLIAVVSCSTVGEPSYLEGSKTFELRIPTTSGQPSVAANDAQKSEWDTLLKNLKEETVDNMKTTYNVEVSTNVASYVFAKGDKVVINTLSYNDHDGVVHFANLTKGTSQTVLLEFWKEPRKDC